MADNPEKFTNAEEIEYPALEDNVDVRVLNNNTRLLVNGQFDPALLDNMAKETSSYKIENDIASLKSSVDGVAKETSNYKIENDIANLKTSVDGVAKETSSYKIETDIASLKTSIDGVAKETSLSGMAKETSSYSIENYVKDLKTEISSLKTTCSSISSAVVPKTKWWELPNIYGRKFNLYNTMLTTSYNSLTTIYSQSGSGSIISLNLPVVIYGYATANVAAMQIQLILDGSIKFNHQINVSFSSTSRKYVPIGIGIHNRQDGYNINWNNSSTSQHQYTTVDPYLETNQADANSTSVPFSRNFISYNQLPYDMYSEYVYTEPISIGSTLQTHNTGVHVASSSTVRNMHSFVHFYDDTSCLSYSSNFIVKFKLDLNDAGSLALGYGGLELTLA